MLVLCSLSSISYAKGGGNSAASRANTRSPPVRPVRPVRHRQRPVRKAVDKGTQLDYQKCPRNYVDTKSQKHWCYSLPNKWYNSINITLTNPHGRTAFSDKRSDVVVKFLDKANQKCFPQMSSKIGNFGIGNYYSDDNSFDCLHDTNEVCTVPITNILPPESCVKLVVIAHVALTVEQVTLKVDNNKIDLYAFTDEDGTSSIGKVFSIFIGMFIMCIFYCCISTNNHSDHYNRNVTQQHNDPFAGKTRCSPDDIDVGLRVQTQYTFAENGDGQWYTGTIVRISPCNLEVTIKYDDGDDWTGSVYDVYHIDLPE